MTTTKDENGGCGMSHDFIYGRNVEEKSRCISPEKIEHFLYVKL